MVRSLVSNLYWDDPVELCGERRHLNREDPDFHITPYVTLQHLCVDRYAHKLSTHINLTLNCIHLFW